MRFEKITTPPYVRISFYSFPIETSKISFRRFSLLYVSLCHRHTPPILVYREGSDVGSPYGGSLPVLDL